MGQSGGKIRKDPQLAISAGGKVPSTFALTTALLIFQVFVTDNLAFFASVFASAVVFLSFRGRERQQFVVLRVGQD